MKRWTNGLPGATKRLGANLALRGLSVSQSGCARIPMMARSKIAPLQRPNTLMQLSRSSVLELPLATRGRAIHIGTSATCCDRSRMAAFAPEAEARRHSLARLSAGLLLERPQHRRARADLLGATPHGSRTSLI